MTRSTVTHTTKGHHMFTVTQHRAFICGGFGWTIRVTCEGAELNTNGELAGLDFGEFWQWITDHMTAVAGTDGVRELQPQQGGRLQHEGVLGYMLLSDPEGVTAERMAAVLLVELRKYSDMVQAVTVVRQRLSSTAVDVVECTVRTNEAAYITQTMLVDAIRRLAVLNKLTTTAGG